jgi:hypothetical protein
MKRKFTSKEVEDIFWQIEVIMRNISSADDVFKKEDALYRIKTLLGTKP